MAAKLKKGDKVVVLAGKDKGKEGEITSVDPKAGKAVVDGVNVSIRHTRQSQTSKVAASRKRCRSNCLTCLCWTKTAKQRALASARKTARKCVSPKPQGRLSDA